MQQERMQREQAQRQQQMQQQQQQRVPMNQVDPPGVRGVVPMPGGQPMQPARPMPRLTPQMMPGNDQR
jgi:hypothetical protein